MKLRIKFVVLVVWSRKKFMMLNLKTFIENISLLLIIINDILNVKEKELVNKPVIDKKLIDVNKKIALNETKHVEADKN